MEKLLNGVWSIEWRNFTLTKAIHQCPKIEAKSVNFYDYFIQIAV